MAPLLPECIETSRLILRPPVPQDADTIFAAYCQDPEVCRYMVWVPHTSVETTRRFIGGCIEGWENDSVRAYVLTRKDDTQVLGMLESRPIEHRMNIGYVLARKHWGQGYMPEAIRALAEIAVSHPALFRIEATCDVENDASARALEKSGFTREGRLARYTVHPNLSPEPRDCWMYAKSR